MDIPCTRYSGQKGCKDTWDHSTYMREGPLATSSQRLTGTMMTVCTMKEGGKKQALVRAPQSKKGLREGFPPESPALKCGRTY